MLLAWGMPPVRALLALLALAGPTSVAADGVFPTGRAVARWRAEQRMGGASQTLGLDAARLGLRWRETGAGDAEVEVDFARGPALKDAWIRFELGERVRLRLGRFRAQVGFLDGASSWSVELGERGPVGALFLDANSFAGRRSGVEGRVAAGPWRLALAALVPEGTGGGIPDGLPELCARVEWRAGRVRYGMGAYLTHEVGEDRRRPGGSVGASWEAWGGTVTAELYAGQASGTMHIFAAGYVAASRQFFTRAGVMEPEVRLSYADSSVPMEGGVEGAHAALGTALWLGDHLRLRATAQANVGACAVCGVAATLEGGARF